MLVAVDPLRSQRFSTERCVRVAEEVVFAVRRVGAGFRSNNNGRTNYFVGSFGLAGLGGDNFASGQVLELDDLLV